MTPFFFLRVRKRTLVFRDSYRSRVDFEDAVYDCIVQFGNTAVRDWQPWLPPPLRELLQAPNYETA